MTSVRSWQNAVAAGRGKCPLSAHDIRQAEKAGLAAYAARVREMAQSGHGVTPHDGNNARMILSSVIELLAMGHSQSFSDMLKVYGEKARRDPYRYSAISYGLQAVEGFLQTKRRAM